MTEINTRVHALVHPTEVTEKVADAIVKIFPEIELLLVEKDWGCWLEGEAKGPDSLRHFRQRLREERILDPARKVMRVGLEGNRISFEINKQVATTGHLSFAPDAGGLGPIHVEISTDDPALVIDWLVPHTQDGRPVEEIEL